MAEEKELPDTIPDVPEAPVPELGEPFLDFDLKKVELEIRQGYRTIILDQFRGQDNVTIKIMNPSVEIDSECSRIYAAKYNELLLSHSKVLTRAEMEDLLKARNIWTDSHDQEVEILDDKMKDVMREGQTMYYNKIVDKGRFRQLKLELTRLQREKNNLISRKQSLLSQSIESLAELASIEHKLYRCTQFVDGTPLWNSEVDFQKENDRFVLGKLLQEAIIFWGGLPQNILGMLPEEDSLQGAISEPLLEKTSG